MTLPVLPECLAGFTHSEATVFMAHRFCVPELGISGHDPQNLRYVLEQLRKRRYDLISIGEMFRRLREREALERAVAFTIDDGYNDVDQIAAPIFAAFDCPATVFAVTGFLDGKMWFWWDKIAYIFRETKRVEFDLRLGKEQFHFNGDGDAGRGAWRTLVGRCYQAPEDDRLACISELSAKAEVELPEDPPASYRPLTWNAARRLESKGISFGPHTVTHPILSKIPAEQSEREITGSWQRLGAEVSRPVPILSYPGGEPTDFGEREITTMGQVGLLGAVTGVPGNLRSGCFDESADRWYRAPRNLYQDSLPSVLQVVSGMETLKAQLRGRLTN